MAWTREKLTAQFMRELVSLRKGDGLRDLANVRERAPVILKTMDDDPEALRQVIDTSLNGTSPNDLAVRVALALPVQRSDGIYVWTGDKPDVYARALAGDLSERRAELCKSNSISLRTVTRWEDIGFTELCKALAEQAYRFDLAKIDHLQMEVSEALAQAEQGNIVTIVRAQQQMIREAKEAILALEQSNNRLVKLLGVDDGV